MTLESIAAAIALVIGPNQSRREEVVTKTLDELLDEHGFKMGFAITSPLDYGRRNAKALAIAYAAQETAKLREALESVKRSKDALDACITMASVHGMTYSGEQFLDLVEAALTPEADEVPK